MMIEIEENMWINPDHVETVWLENVDTDGKIQQVHLQMVSGDNFTLQLPITLESVIETLNEALSPAPRPRGYVKNGDPYPWATSGYTPTPRV